MNKMLQRVKSLIGKIQKKHLILAVVLFVGVILIIMLRGGATVKLSPISISIPSFNTEEQSTREEGSSTINIPAFTTTGDDEVVTTDPDIVIEEDLSDPDAYRRNGLEGTDELVIREPDPDDLKILEEINNGKSKMPGAQILPSNVGFDDAVAEKLKLQGRIPYYITNFQTSNGRQVDIVITASEYDSEDEVQLLIQQIEYNYPAVSESNPEMIAYRDGFLRAKADLESWGIDIKKLHLKLGVRGYVATTANNWVTTLGLLN